LNIDGYIAKVHRALDRFSTSISTINTVIAQKIDRILDDELMQPSCLLFSREFLRSKVRWPLNEFTDEMRTHLYERAKDIGKKFFRIQETFREVEEMLKSNTSEQTKSRTSTSSTTTRRAKSNFTPTVSNEAMRSFVHYYYNRMNHCIDKLIERSLSTFIELAATTETKYLLDQTKLIRFLFEGQNHDDDDDDDEHQHETNVDTNRIRFVESHLISSQRTTTRSRLACTMQYAIPEILIEPQLAFCQKSMLDMARSIIDCSKHISGKTTDCQDLSSSSGRTPSSSVCLSVCRRIEAAGFSSDTQRHLSSLIDSNIRLSSLLTRLTSIETDVSRVSQSAIQYIQTFDFLWRDDSQLKYQTIIQQDENNEDYTIIIDPEGIPSLETRKYLQGELERLVHIETRLQLLPHELQIGCISLETVPIINSLQTFVFSWKTQYAKLLHHFAKTELDQVVAYRQEVQVRFNDDVATLEQLDEALILLEELSEMENKIE
jgi:hypothetical protein